MYLRPGRHYPDFALETDRRSIQDSGNRWFCFHRLIGTPKLSLRRRRVARREFEPESTTAQAQCLAERRTASAEGIQYGTLRRATACDSWPNNLRRKGG